MLIPLVLGSLMIVVNMVVQILTVVFLLRLLMRKIYSGGFDVGLWVDVKIVSLVLIVLLIGHIMQFATWALLFVAIGEFSDFATAFYYSTVNFTSLGYGDIVMNESWRLLGGLEAANGVLMFGLSAGTLLAVMNRVFRRHVNQQQPDSN